MSRPFFVRSFFIRRIFPANIGTSLKIHGPDLCLGRNVLLSSGSAEEDRTIGENNNIAQRKAYRVECCSSARILSGLRVFSARRN